MNELNQKRANALKAINEQKKAEEQARKEARLQRLEELNAQIKALRPRIDELVELGNACIENGISLENTKGTTQSYETGFFVSNAWNLMTGFTYVGGKVIGVSSKLGADYSCNLEVIGSEINFYGCERERILMLEHFLREFDEFEREFYKFVDKKCGM